MNNEIQAQRAFWNSEADAFQRIYTHRKSRFANTLDQIFRKDMYERYEFTIANCEPIRGRNFLDVGCGNGLYSLELARKGAGKVTGIDSVCTSRTVAACAPMVRKTAPSSR